VEPAPDVYLDAPHSRALHSGQPLHFNSRDSPANADQESVDYVLSLLASIGYTGICVEDLGKLNPPDEYETELRVMAEVRGYFQVSYKRVIDNVPSLIDLKFIKAIPKDIQAFLISKLGLEAADAVKRCANYLAEDPTMVSRRDELMARQKRLNGVKLELHHFGI